MQADLSPAWEGGGGGAHSPAYGLESNDNRKPGMPCGLVPSPGVSRRW